MEGSFNRLSETSLAFETKDLRDGLKKFYEIVVVDAATAVSYKLGNVKWGVYAFFDYDGEPVYVGQTYESLGARIGRHLTNQRTDAVAMSVLDPFEVLEIAVWSLTQFHDLSPTQKTKEVTEAKTHLDALERMVFDEAVAKSTFKAILNEKDPKVTNLKIVMPQCIRRRVLSDEVVRLRGHPDLRIARRSLIISRLAQVISERKVQGGLRRVLLVQARRLEHLALGRYEGLGGAATVQIKTTEAAEENDET